MHLIGGKMGYKSKCLSHDEICAIYTCLHGHIHVKYRTLDIAMEPEEFLQVAQVFTDALRILQRKEDTVNEEISLADIGAIQKV